MRRREFITVLGGAATWSLTARAQQSDRMRRVGILMPLGESDLESRRRVVTFSQMLRQIGWIEGQTIIFEKRFADSVMCGRSTYKLTWEEIVRLYRLTLEQPPPTNRPARLHDTREASCQADPSHRRGWRCRLHRPQPDRNAGRQRAQGALPGAP